VDKADEWFIHRCVKIRVSVPYPFHADPDPFHVDLDRRFEIFADPDLGFGIVAYMDTSLDFFPKISVRT